jgi:hypothetical protein
MLTLLTATGCRPDAWALCEQWMARQTYAGPVRWVIVDDGIVEQPITFARDGWACEVLRPVPRWRLGENTQARNLREGLEVIGADARVVIIEDDDWYAPDWLEHVSQALEASQLVGEARARYYNVRTSLYREHGNEQHASLCATAVRDEALAALRFVTETAAKFIDLVLWKQGIKEQALFTGHRVVGMKGLPGRYGIGYGHTASMRGMFDPTGVRLRQWIGDDADAYAQWAHIKARA